MKTVLVLILLALAGCAAPPTMVRIVEYGSNGAAGAISGDIGGCSAYQHAEGKVFADITIHYAGERCTVDVRVPAPGLAPSGGE